MTLDELIAELQRVREVFDAGSDRVVIILKSGTVKTLSGKVVMDARLDSIAIKTVA